MEVDPGFRHVLEEYCRFGPTPFHTVDYYLPILIAGKPLPAVVAPMIHSADVYACDPEVLAAQYDHALQCGDTGDRFFFTPCKRLKGRGNRSQRTVGNDGGSWALQHNKHIKDAAGVKVGEHKTLVHSKGGERTKWLMDEYRCFPCPQEALVAGAEMVMCKIHFAKSKGDKRPPPVAADRPCVKKMRVAPSSTPPMVHPACSPVFAPPPPPAYAPPAISLPMAPAPAPVAAEGDDGDQDRFVCTMDELLGFYAGEDLPALDQQAAVFASNEFGAIPTPEEFGHNVDMPPADAEQQMPVLASDDNVDMSQFTASLEDDLCRAQEEEAPPVDDKQPAEQQFQLTDSLEDEFGFIQDALPENPFPMIDDDLQELNDFNNFMSHDGMFGGSEQQLPILVSDDDGGIPAPEEAENIDTQQFVTSLQEEEEAFPADVDMPLPDPFTNAEFNELLSHVGRIDEDVVLNQDNWDFIQGELDDFTLDQFEGHMEFISYA